MRVVTGATKEFVSFEQSHLHGSTPSASHNTAKEMDGIFVGIFKLCF
jgi:hypothetical protein